MVPASTGFENFTSISVPPAKSTPKLRPWTAGTDQTMTARLAMSESTTAMWRFPTKSYFVPWGTMSKVLNSISDAQLRRVAAREVLHQDAGDEDGGEEGGDEADDQGDGEALHGAGAELHEHEARDEGGHVGIE